MRALIASLLLATSVPAIPASPPEQPASGAGGRSYFHDDFTIESRGAGSEQYWIFAPAVEPKAPPKSGGDEFANELANQLADETAPVVVFLHGWGAMNPSAYGGWIRHLVRRGHTVMFPRYQESLLVPPIRMTDHTLAALRDARDRLRLDAAPWVIIGHSMGAIIGANVAARAREAELLPPTVVMAIEPGGTNTGYAQANIAYADLAKIAPSTLLVTMAGEDDERVGDVDAREIFFRASSVPLARKRFIVIRSDYRGSPPVVANHFAPASLDDSFDTFNLQGASELRRRIIEQGRGTTAETLAQAFGESAIDYYAFWKLADLLIDAGLAGERDPFAPARAAALANMGMWSDGTPVEPLDIQAKPRPVSGMTAPTP